HFSVFPPQLPNIYAWFLDRYRTSVCAMAAIADSNHKGTVAEAEIAAAAIRLGIPVLKPLSEHSRYDLVFDLGDRLARIQCKWGRLDRDGDVISVRIGTSRFTPRGYVVSCYTTDEIDYVAVYSGELDRCFLLPATQ